MTEAGLRAKYRDLAGKYTKDAFWYIEYPHKSFWSENFGDQEYRKAIKELVEVKKNPPLLLYLHIPFCQQMCYFCVCHFHITQDYGAVNGYMQYLHKEMDLLRDYFKELGVKPNIKEVHVGGGSPTYLHPKEFDALVDKIRSLVEIESLREFVIEIDPRRVDKDKLRFYQSRGINRLSFGIQDFDPNVQKAINRIQPAKLTEDLLTPDIRKLFGNGINFDIICGLAGQTRQTFRRTIEKVIELSPDKISLTFLAYSPEKVKHQALMTKHAKLPDLYEKKMLWVDGLELLVKSGYVRMGYDHFAKPTDPVAKARQEKKMAWNSFGFTPGVCVDILGLGEHSYSTIGPNYYSQNTYERKKYEESVMAGRFPVFRGHHLNQDDLIRREVIQNLRGYFGVTFKDIEKKYGINFKDYFRDELASLGEFLEDGLVELAPGALNITDLGQQFTNVVCAHFDRYMDKPQLPAPH